MSDFLELPIEADTDNYTQDLYVIGREGFMFLVRNATTGARWRGWWNFHTETDPSGKGRPVEVSYMVPADSVKYFKLVTVFHDEVSSEGQQDEVADDRT